MREVTRSRLSPKTLGDLDGGFKELIHHAKLLQITVPLQSRGRRMSTSSQGNRSADRDVFSVVIEQCPRCGGAGKLRLHDTYRAVDRIPSRTNPERFDCPTGCFLDRKELTEVFKRYRK
jgi:hypothetical protein